MPSSYQAAMTVIVGIAAPVLKAAGFGKRRHTFNRQLEPGLVHRRWQLLVVSFGPPHREGVRAERKYR